MNVKGSTFWKDITILIISAVLIPIVVWGFDTSKQVAVNTKEIANLKELVLEIRLDVKTLLQRK